MDAHSSPGLERPCTYWRSQLPRDRASLILIWIAHGRSQLPQARATMCILTLTAPPGSSVSYLDLNCTWTLTTLPGSSVHEHMSLILILFAHGRSQLPRARASMYILTLTAPPGSSVSYFDFICAWTLTAPPGSSVHVQIFNCSFRTSNYLARSPSPSRDLRLPSSFKRH
jgi:hypothetical protein